MYTKVIRLFTYMQYFVLILGAAVLLFGVYALQSDLFEDGEMLAYVIVIMGGCFVAEGLFYFPFLIKKRKEDQERYLQRLR